MIERLSLRAHFAVRAPEAIPEWFVHIEPPKTFPPMPDFESLDETHQEIARNWQQDPCYDLPEELAWYQAKVVAHRAGRSAWNTLNERARYAQWRWAYADLMIESIPDPVYTTLDGVKVSVRT